MEFLHSAAILSFEGTCNRHLSKSQGGRINAQWFVKWHTIEAGLHGALLSLVAGVSPVSLPNHPRDTSHHNVSAMCTSIITVVMA